VARRLSAHENALWQRVAATVRPIDGKARVEAPILPPTPMPHAPRTTPRPPEPPPIRRASVPVTAATLDGGWDQRLRRGQIRPDRVIDLHGYTLADAHAVLATALDDAAIDGVRVILVITGKGRHDRPSRIKAELADWLESGTFRHRIAALRPAHPRHGGGGAYYLILRRTAVAQVR
jgi:DNA-nicking Smr family endonuclease